MNSFILLQTQFENLGDLIINKMLIDELCRYGNVYLDLGKAPQNFSAPLLMNVNAIDVAKEKKTYTKGLRAYILRFLLFRRYNIRLSTTAPGPIYPHEKERISKKIILDIIYYLNKCLGTKSLKIGNCCSHLQVEQIPFKANRIDAYYLRSQESVRYLSQYISSKKVSYIPDLCFLLKYQVKPIAKKKYAILDLRSSENPEIYTWCQKIVNDLVSQGFEVILYYQVEKDRQPMLHLYEYLKRPGVSVRDNIVWYNDLQFYADKMFVISNRLHSLLIGAAYEVYPICINEETVLTSKLKHVFKSSFSKDLPIIFNTDTIPSFDFNDLYFSNIEKINKEFSDNAKICRETIFSLVEKLK